MMSTVCLELMDYINPNLTWKTVAKGFRSSSRRTRKHVFRNFAVGQELSHPLSRKVDEGTASDTEKQGVAVLGRRFSDKIENIPLKKRRLMIRSDSPPPRSLFEHPANGKSQVRESGNSTRGAPENNGSKVEDNAIDLNEDFSGMEILAAVACSDSTIGDVDLDTERSLVRKSTRDVIGLCASEAPVVKNGSSPKDMACEETDKESSLLGKLEGVKNGSTPNGMSCGETDKESSLLGKLEGVLLRPPVIKEIETIERSGSGRDDRLHWDLNVPEDAWEKPCDASTTDSHENASLCLSTGTGGRVEVARNSELTVVSNDIPDSSSKLVSEDAMKDLPLRHHEAAGAQNGFETCVVLDKNSEGHTPDSAADELLVCEVADVKGSSKISVDASIYCFNIKQGTEVLPSDTTLNKLDDYNVASPVSLDLEKPPHEWVPNPKSSQDTELVSSAVKVEAPFKESCGSTIFASGAHAEVGSPPHERSEDMMQKSSGDSTSNPKGVSGIPDNGPTGDPSDDSYGSDVYQTEKVGMVGAECNNELQAGYDSQFEDGELRESDARYYWDENEGEDGEVEHVDYGSEYGDDNVERLGSMQDKDVEFVRGGSTPGSYDRKADCSAKSDVACDDSVSPKNRVLDVPHERALAASGADRTRALLGEFASCAEGPDARKNPYSRSRFENCRSVFSRDERDSERYSGGERAGMHIGSRSPGRCSANHSTSYWNFERRNSPTRPAHFPGRPTPKNSVELRRYMMQSDRNMDSEARSYFENRINRQQFVSSPPNGVYERIMRRRSPSSRDDAYTNMRMLPRREMSPTRGRFRSFTPGGGRGEFRRPLPEYSAELYPNRIGQHRLLKRDRSRSISPLPRPLSRRPHIAAFPYRRSRSRSRSPPIYMQRQQRRNEAGSVGSVMRSRSPDGTRVRLPFQKRFAAKYNEEDHRFPSPTTRHPFSNRCGARSFDDRALDGFRGGGRRSPPVRIYRQQQRLDFRPSRKLDSNTANARDSGEFKASEDDRSKRNHRFDTRPVPMGRFRCNADDDSLEGNDSSTNFDNAGGGPRDVIRRPEAVAE